MLFILLYPYLHKSVKEELRLFVKITNGNLYLKKRTFPEWAVCLVLFLPFTFSFFVELLNLPGIVNFIVDFVLMVMACLIVLKRPFRLSRNLLPIFTLVLFFLIYTFIVYLFNYQSILYYFWGFRNNFRFFVAFFIFASFVYEEAIKGYFKWLDILFWINFAVTLIQFVMGYKQDYLGGLFGVEKGCNAYMINFLLVIVVRSVLSFMNKTENIFYCFSKCAVSLFISAVAELKFFYVVFVIIVVMATFLTSFSWRKFALVLSVSAVTILSALLLVTMFEHLKDFFSLETIWKVATQKNYASDIDMNRFSSIPIISDIFLTDTPSRLFGMGLGNCDTSSISFFNTPFYDNYVDLHYSVFSLSFLYLETGFVGLFLYFTFFALCFRFAYKNYKNKTGNLLFNQMATIMSAICFILIFYNSSLRTEAGYLIYFVLALPFIGARADAEDETTKTLLIMK